MVVQEVQKYSQPPPLIGFSVTPEEGIRSHYRCL
uniref:Uncharacterized protein n=1 Tax=Trichinella nativa TaxID=6335 RepID=A0A0V1KHD5_9BILA